MISIIKYCTIITISLLFVNKASANVDLTIESLTTQNEYGTTYSGTEYLLGTLEIGISTDDDIMGIVMGVSSYYSFSNGLPYGGLVEELDWFMSSLSGNTITGYHYMFPQEYFIPAGTTNETLMYLPILIFLDNDEEFCIQYPDFTDLEGNSLIVNLGDESCISIDALSGFDPNVEILGCTDSLASNYNPSATTDDGSCDYTDIIDCDCVSEELVCIMADFGQTITVPWCMVECGTFTTWDPITGEIIEPIIVDCGEIVSGCTDSNALNFNDSATVNDGSCVYIEDEEDNNFTCALNEVTIQFELGSWPDEVSWSIIDDEGIFAEGSANDGQPHHACLPDGCYTLVMNDSWNDGWSGNIISLSNSNGVVFLQTTLVDGSSGLEFFALNSECEGLTYGCTDPNAANYNSEANSNDGTCEYGNANAEFDSVFAEELFNLFEEFSGGGQFNEDNFQDILDILIDIFLFPNPVEEGGMIEVVVDSNTEANAFIQIFNSLGQVVYSKDENLISGKNRFQVDVKNLESGIYITTLTSSGLTVSERFVKN